MEKTGLATDPAKWFSLVFLNEKNALFKRNQTAEAKILAVTQKTLLQGVKKVGQTADLNLIIAVEKSFLMNEEALYADTKAAKGSLQEALAGIDVAERMSAMVRDPALYKIVDESYSRPKSRIGGVPRDEARQFFSTHADRLLNLDKARLTPEEKAVINERKLNMRVAEKVYTALQEQALGIAPEKGPTQEQELSR